MINILKIPAIYKIRHIKSSKVYVGSASNAYRRCREHFNQLRKNKHHSILLQRAFNKYGEDQFIFEIIEIVKNPTKKKLETREQFWMDYYKSYNPEKGYNICEKAGTTLGMGGWHHTEEAKAKISEAGHRPCNPKTAIKISLAQKGKPKPLSVILKMRGRKFTKEHKQKLRLAKLGKPSCRKGIKVQFCPKGHNTFVTGRYKYGNCKICMKEYRNNGGGK